MPRFSSSGTAAVSGAAATDGEEPTAFLPRRSTRSSLSTRADMEDYPTLDGLKERPRRALGDVSNKNAKEGSAAGNADRGKRKRPPLRRSRRLSRECLEDNKLAEDERDARPNRVLAKETGSQKKKKVPPKTSRVASKQGGTRRTSGRLPNHRQASTSNANGNQVDRKPAPKKAKGTKRTRTEFEENDGDESLGYSDIRRASKKRRGKSHGGAVEQPAAAVAGPPRRRINRGSRRSSAGSIQDVIMEDAFLGEDLSSSECHSASLVMTTKNPCPDLLVKSEHDHGLKRNIPGPFDASKFTTGYSNFDRYTRDDVDQVSAYATDIFQRLYQAELRHRPLAGYLEQGLQHEINSSMRAMLVDWIVEVHMKFRLLPETLYLCVNILDRYLCVGRRVRRNKLQLVGVTTLLIACKYEEIHPPEVKDCVYITDQAYTRQDILGMEAEILNAVGFRISSGTAYPFLQRFLHITQATRTVENLASYYLERMLQEHCMLQYRGSAVAATAVCLAWNNPGVVEQEGVALGVPQTLLEYTGFTLERIHHVADVMSEKIRQGNEHPQGRNRKLGAVIRKYESERFDNASRRFPEPHTSHLGGHR